MTTPLLTSALANQQARALGHRPRPWREFGVMRLAECQTCRAAMVENRSDSEGVTGAMVEKPCGRKP